MATRSLRKKVAGGYFISPYSDEISEQLIAADKITEAEFAKWLEDNCDKV